MAAYTTKKPTGLSIKRNANALVIEWKLGDKNYGGGQTFQYRYPGQGWQSITIGTATTKTHIVVPVASFFPTTGKFINKVYFRIRGKRRNFTEDGKSYTPSVSDWATKEYSILPPNRPTMSAALSGSADNVCTFSWDVKVDSESQKYFVKVQCQTCLLNASAITSGANVPSNLWTNYNPQSTGASGSAVITEDSTVISAGSHTRWFRVRACGPAGATQWSYARHVYTAPFQTKNVRASARTTDSGGYMCTVNWETPLNAAKPVDKINVQYTFTTPTAGLGCPDSASWTDAQTLNYKNGTDAASFSIDSSVSDDQCLFVRINTIHDRKTTYGAATLATAGNLIAPSGLSVVPDSDTHRATVTAINNSQVPGAFLAVRYMTKDDPDGFDIGVIPSGETSVTVQCPEFSSSSDIRFGVYAVVGEYAATVRGDGVTSYAVTPVIKSSLVTYGGTVPAAPSSVLLTQTATPGTIRVTFDWAWQAATAAELSWADHEDAWESTDGPSTYMIPNTHASAWNISGLETGKTWYVRVRLASGVGENQTFGAYSAIVAIDLSSAPTIPIMSLSDSVITEDGSVTASWGFVSSDGTAQASAEIAQVVNNVYTKIAEVESAQYVTIAAADAGWVYGQTYSMAVRVTSASGRRSEWSDVVTVTIAEPLTAEITQISLVEQEIKENPQTYSGGMASFESDGEKQVTSLTASISPIQAGSGDPSPSNVRAISGWSSVKVTRAGKNLAAPFSVNSNGTSKDVTYDYTDNVITFNGTSTGANATTQNKYFGGNNPVPIVLKAGITYTASLQGRVIFTNKLRLILTYQSSLVAYFDSVDNTWTFTPDTDLLVTQAAIRLPTAGSTADIVAKFQIEVGTTATEFEEYTGSTYEFALGSTVYGGTLDVLTGVLTVDKARIDLGTLNWYYNENGYYYANTGDKKAGTTNIICDCYKTSSADTAADMTNLEIRGHTNSYIFIKDTSYGTAEALAAALDGHYAVYEVSSPTTVQLTEQEVVYLVGMNNIWADSGDITAETADTIRTSNVLTELPLTVTVTGAGTGGTTRVVIERAEAYHIVRPDEREYDGFEGETVVIMSQTGEAQISIGLDDLVGHLDDGAAYRIIATVQDGIGQSSEVVQEFEVHWSHQALIPSATVTIEDGAAVLSPEAPAGALTTDVCDIYRLSADRPELIYPGAEFGEDYVDPYPAIGGGYRFVFRTANGDYITENDELAWLDVSAGFESEYSIIDFDGGRVLLEYNSDLSSSWRKDFTETKYLGGSVQGDWNAAVSRTGTLTAAVVTDDEDTISTLRRLAVHTGICHVRTKDGSSFTADVQVSESRKQGTAHKIAEFSLSITRVDPETYDGIAYDDWLEENNG